MTAVLTTQEKDFDSHDDSSLSKYERYHIIPIPTEPRKALPHPFWPKIKKFGLISFLTKEALHLNVKLVHSKYRKVLFQRPCIYGVFDRPVGGLAPIRSKCVGCMRCAQEVPDVCSVERNPEFYSFGDSYWIPEDMKLVSSTPLSLVNFEASSGKILVKGMGYKGSFGSRHWDSMWTDMSEIVRPTRDGVYGREFISMAVNLGGKKKFLDFSNKGSFKSSTTVSTSIPIIFDYLAENLSSADILASIKNSALKTNTLFSIHFDVASTLNDSELAHAIVLVDSNKDYSISPIISKAAIVEVTSDNMDIFGDIKKLRPSKPVALRLKLTDNYNNPNYL